MPTYYLLTTSLLCFNNDNGNENKSVHVEAGGDQSTLEKDPNLDHAKESVEEMRAD